MRSRYLSLLTSTLLLYGCQIQSALARVDTVRTFPAERYLAGANGFSQHLMRMLRYPPEAQQASIVGISLVSVVLTPSGKLTQLTIVNSLGKAIDEEVTRVINATNKLWLPADATASRDSMMLFLPFRFTLTDKNFYVDDVKPAFILEEIVVVGYNPQMAYNVRDDSYYVSELTDAFQKKDHKRMLKLVNELIRRNPYSDSLYLQRAKIEQELGQTDAACSDYKKIVYFLGRPNFPKKFLQNCSESPTQGGSKTTSVQASGEPPIEEEIFTICEVPPDFPGGIDGLSTYIQQNLRYPEAARNAKVRGNVFVSFVVTKEGAIQRVRVLKGLGYGTNEEAIRLMQSMPNWIPGKQSGRPVNVEYNLPIPFTPADAK